MPTPIKQRSGFTIIEVLIIVGIIGIIAALVTISITNSRARSRDAKRVADIRQWQTALDLYYANNTAYPTYATPGNALLDGATTYMNVIPQNPTPYNDGRCPNNEYTYSQASGGSDYTINFCLGAAAGGQPAGLNAASLKGLGTAPGLVGWWKLDGNALDSAGSNNGTVSASSWGTGRYGESNGAFDSNNGRYITITDNSLLNGKTTLSISLWLKRTGFNVWADFFSSGNDGADRERFEDAGVEGNIAEFSSGLKASSFTLYGNGVVSTGAWHHLVVTADGSTIKSYKDGALINSNLQDSGGAWNGTGNIYLGQRYPLYTNWNGLLADVRIYNRALSAQEVADLYNATK